ncbi:lipopolysaccharide core heptose(II)-phosphate phosphatase, partial [Escherichia coli]
PKTSIICSPMTSLKTSIKTITYLSDTGCLEIQGASLIYSSNAVRTIQTAKFFSGKEPVVMDSLSDCNNDLYKTLESIARESHKRNIVIMTHNHCLSFLARDRLGKKFKPAYLDALIMHYDGTRLILDGKYNKEA